MILITQPRVGHSHNEILALQYAARSLEWDVLSAPSSWRLDDQLIASGVPGVPYGSQMFCEVIAQQMNWILHQNSFDWLSKLPQYALSRQVNFMTLEEAAKLKERKFIKPADDKCFDAKIYEPGEFNPNELIVKDYPVLVSDIVQFDLEYRCFVGVVDNLKNESRPPGLKANRVLTWSNYIFFEEVANPKFWNMIPADLGEVSNFLEPLLFDLKEEGIKTKPSVIDVGRIPGKGWAVIETNPVWASGLYGCDPIEALKTMAQAVS